MKLHTIFAGLSLILSAESAQTQSSSLQPDVFVSAGYFLMARLDPKCPKSDPLRTSALEKYRTHYLEGVEQLDTYMKPNSSDALEKLRQLAVTNLPSEQTDVADAFWARFPPARITEICANAPTKIERLIVEETRLREAFQKQQEGRTK